MMWKYYSHHGFLPFKHNEEGKDIHNEIFNNIPHLIRSIFVSTFFRIVLLYTMVKYSFEK